MKVRYPAPLSPGDRVGVTAPSAGVPAELRPRFEAAVRTVESRGYEVVVGDCIDGSGLVSAPAPRRARELMDMLTDPDIKAVVPPWGGETAIDLLPLLDWDALRAAEPTWLVGFSDTSTYMTPLTLLTGVATVHGNNLMDTPYRAPDGLLTWLDIVTMEPGTRFTQTPPGLHRGPGWDDWEKDPEVSEFTLDVPGRWRRLDAEGPVDVEGRLIGGCIETLCHAVGSPYCDMPAFARSQAPDGLLVYVEACEYGAAAICRCLHGMRLAGFFDGAAAILVGRTPAPATGSFTQDDAVLDALGGLGVPIIADVECGHVQPFLPIVNGARGRVVCTEERDELTQTLD
ncbi:LD-carboxypeptidase [Nonomuraea sp. NN258]|uniref:S66 family peptidase n=1 Tax=Nonomuraea antri TaxID=2730852 RepID=UPI0015693775|nr:S66 peptidase family protein [Nonomuraea antri]NRQ39044.1 LD-carboxypeptidase [Nonomuraea antri]